MQGSFEGRHIGPQSAEKQQMLQAIGAKSLDQLIDETVPAGIRPGSRAIAGTRMPPS